MENGNQTVFVIDLYNKYSSDKVVDIFNLNGRWWAIKEVNLIWGIPQLSSIEEDSPMSFQIYNTIDEAKTFVRKIKSLEGTRI